MTREELWLAAIAGLEGAVPPDSPGWHYEQMLAAIYDAFTAGTAVNLVMGSDSTYVYRAVQVEDNGLGDFGVLFWAAGDALGYFCDATNKSPARDLS